jgi:hypothetical protein
MKRSKFFTMLLALFFAPMAPAMAITLTPVEYGRQAAADDVAEALYNTGTWHVFAASSLGLSSDAGFFGPGYALFDLSSVTMPAANASLSVQVNYRYPDGSNGLYDWPFPVAIYDVNDMDALVPPDNWQSSMSLNDYLSSFFEVKNDLTSGEVYGEFSIPPLSEGMAFNILFSSAGVATINAFLGQPFAIAFGPGSPVDGEGGIPSEGLSISLENVSLDIASTTAPVPEPATMLLVGIGLISAGIFRSKKKQR